jgi:hypothetical protein
MNRHVWEGWTVQDFINYVQPFFDRWPRIDDLKKLRKEIKNAQPYYKKHIPEVYNYFKKLNNKKLNTNNY